MKVPKYVTEILERAEFSTRGDYIPGYTIKIAKRNHYVLISTFRKEIERLVEWANREYQRMSKDDEVIATINDIPTSTVYKYMQYATVTIYDPVMRHIEKLITDNK